MFVFSEKNHGCTDDVLYKSAIVQNVNMNKSVFVGYAKMTKV
jgi:hypothetical protein